MATLNELAYDLQNIARGGIISDDELMSIEQFKFWIHNTRAMLIRQDISKRRTISDNIKQILNCVEVESVDASLCCGITTGCKVVRSKKRIPLPVELPNRDMILEVRPVKITEPSFHFIPYNRVAWAGNNRYTKELNFAFMLDGYMHVMGKDLGVLEKMSVVGIFANPTDLAEFGGCDNKPCFDDDTIEYPISAHMIETMKGMIIANNLKIMAAAPTDTQGNSKHDLRPNQTQ